MEYGEALTLIGGLSHPSKMPWWAWSISAAECVTGSKLAAIENTICSGCYALKGHYMFPNVQDAQARRARGAEDPRWVQAFVVVLKRLHAKTRKQRSPGMTENRFRWFDAGDLQSPEMLRNINDIALQTPEIDHWLPTREMGIVRDFLSQGGAFAPNLLVRMSAPKVGVAPKRQPFGLSFSTVEAESDAHQCVAMAEQGNRCLTCDKCWKTGNINYPLH